SRAGAQRWMLANPRHAVAGLFADALGEPGKDRDRAERALRWLAKSGHEDAVVARAKKYGGEVEEAIVARLAFDPLFDFPTKLPKSPDWLKPEALPRPVLRSGGALPISALENVTAMLSFSSFEFPYAGLSHVKDACAPSSLDAFCQALCESWV